MSSDTVSGDELREAIENLTNGAAILRARYEELQRLAEHLETIGDLVIRTSAYMANKEPLPPAHAARLHRCFPGGTLAVPQLEFLAVRAAAADDWAARVLDLVEHDEA